MVRIRSPKYADVKEVEYISGLVNEMEQAIRSEDGVSETGKTWLDYIDLDSWVKWYMVSEIAYDPDKGWTSVFFYKDADSVDSHIHMGPVWDFDKEFGGTSDHAEADILTKISPNSWIQDLYDRPQFFEAVCREWKAFFRDHLAEEAPKKIDAWREQIRKSVAMDNILWYRGEGYMAYWPYEDGKFTCIYDFDVETDYLKNWIRRRREFLDTCWAE